MKLAERIPSRDDLALLLARGRRRAGAGRRQLRDWWRGETRTTMLDLHNPAELNEHLDRYVLRALTPQPGEAEASVSGAARFVAALLAHRPGLHRRFPGGLAAGPRGGLCRWVTGFRARRLGLSAAGAENVRRAFADNLAWRAGLAFQARADIREAHPLGLTPTGRGNLLAWMLHNGRDEVGFTEGDAWWAAFERAEDPAGGLVDSFLLHPRWQRAVPHGVTPYGWAQLKEWLTAEYGLGGRWFEEATPGSPFDPWDELLLLLRAKPALAATFPWHAAGSPTAVDRWVKTLIGLPVPGLRKRWDLGRLVKSGVATQPRVTLLGLFRYASGLQQAARGMSEALTRAGVRVDHRDVPGPVVRENPTGVPLDRVEIGDVTIVHTGLDTSVPEAFSRAGLAPRDDVYRVATWWWELEQLPDQWLGRGADVDEIWAPTRFIADAMRPLGRPVFTMLPGLELPDFERAGKAKFGMTRGKFTFAVLFDANSRLGRKNPLGAVRAFRRAFAPGDPVELVVKMSPGSGPPAGDVLELRHKCAAAGVRLIESVFSRSDTFAFMDAADALISLHRSEGFGLPLAEAMLLGKPVVATGYSGNVDFMTPDNSYLVDFARVPIEVDDPPYRKGFVWAEPSVEHAAAVLTRVAADREAARAVGLRARDEVRKTLSVEAAGKRMRARLEAIAAERAARRRPGLALAGGR